VLGKEYYALRYIAYCRVFMACDFTTGITLRVELAVHWWKYPTMRGRPVNLL
jgi:hypothetical protein